MAVCAAAAREAKDDIDGADTEMLLDTKGTLFLCPGRYFLSFVFCGTTKNRLFSLIIVFFLYFCVGWHFW